MLTSQIKEYAYPIVSFWLTERAMAVLGNKRWADADAVLTTTGYLIQAIIIQRSVHHM